MDQGLGLFPSLGARAGEAWEGGLRPGPPGRGEDWAGAGAVPGRDPGVVAATLLLVDPFGLRDDVVGERMEEPDLHLELHTREYYARFMSPGAPRAVWFLNLPGGYFHNEALLDHYDFVFTSHPLGRNYGRFHPRCHFLAPFLPAAWTGGSGEAGTPGRRYAPGVDPGRDELAGMLVDRARLRGTYAGNPREAADLPFVYGLCLKADAVLADAASPLAGECRAAGAGLHAPGDPGTVVEACLPLAERRERVLTGCLFGHRLAEIAGRCLGARP
jgi:hypothetical protein